MLRAWFMQLIGFWDKDYNEQQQGGQCEACLGTGHGMPIYCGKMTNHLIQTSPNKAQWACTKHNTGYREIR